MAIPNAAPPRTVALIGLGSIGISFAALHLQHTTARLAVYDPRPDLASHLATILPVYFQGPSVDELLSSGRLRLATSIDDACAGADLVQEQGPEKLTFKTATLAAVSKAAPPHAHLWSSTSGIPVSSQVASLDESDSVRRRLLVVHPFNPPHILPLIEISPGTETAPEEVEFAKNFFESLGAGHRVVVVRKEVPGFVGNRLAFALLREAVSLVNDGVVGVDDVDAVVEASLGPRWAVQGPFKSYAMGGGTAGLGAFLKNLSGSIQTVWDSQDATQTHILEKEKNGAPADWVDTVVKATDEAYGKPTPAAIEDRDATLRRVIQARKP
ncbi:hypothetical protein SEUCBS139899_006783 [Sporothrix eucalyptigena]|uniref:L-gulonate 3-dehydrogenase n=1 Tax=Sporothrix eucalyptigena TaxID=1812306 RepID=A0ABP0CVJ0_9PEZI